MAVLGRLQVFLSLNMAGFVAQMQTAKGSLTSLGATVTRNSAAFKTAGRNMMIAGGIMAAGLILSVKAAADFEEGMAKVNTMLTSSTEKYLPEFGKALRSMSVEYGQSMKTLTDGTYDVLSAQMGAAKAMKIMRVASKSAIGGFTDTKTAASAAITMLKAYPKALKDVTDASDWLHATVEYSRLTFEELANTIGTVAATANKGGMSVEGLSATIAVLTQGGLEARKAMTGLRAMILSVIKRSPASIAMAEKFGVTWDMNALRAENLIDTLKKLNKANADQLAVIAPNIRAITSLAIAAGQADEALRAYEGALNRTGMTEAKYQKAKNTLNQQMRELKETFNMTRIVIGEQLIPVLKELTTTMQTNLKWFNKLAEANPKLTKSIVGLTAEFSALLLAAGAVSLVLAKVGGAAGILKLALKSPLLFIYAMNKLWNKATDTLDIFIDMLDTAIKVGEDLTHSYHNQVSMLTQDIKRWSDVLADSERNLTEKQRQVITALIEEQKRIRTLMQERLKSGKITAAQAKDMSNLVSLMADRIKLTTDLVLKQKKAIKVEEKTVKNLRQLIQASKEYKDLQERIYLLGISEQEKLMRLRYKELVALKEKWGTETAYYKEMAPLIDEYYRKQIEALNKVESIGVQTARAMADGFKTAFRGVMTREITSFKDFTMVIFDKIRNAFADMVANMMTEWMFGQQFMSGGAFKFADILGGLGSLFGGGSGGFVGTAVSNSTTAAMGARMGYQHGTDYVPTDGVYNLHKGEKIVPRTGDAGHGDLTIVNLISPGFIGEAIRREPGMVINPITEDIIENGMTRKVIKDAI